MSTPFRNIILPLLGVLGAWGFYTELYIYIPVQQNVFCTEQACPSELHIWLGEILLTPEWNNHVYTTHIHTTASIIATAALTSPLDADLNWLYAQGLLLQHASGAAATNLWSSFLALHFTYETPRNVSSVVVEAATVHQYDANGILIIWGQIISLAILTIWARGVGPRFRPDQLSELTWKDLLVFLLGMLILTVTFIN